MANGGGKLKADLGEVDHEPIGVGERKNDRLHIAGEVENEAGAVLVAKDAGIDHRGNGGTGRRAGDRHGKNWSAQGNILAGPQVPEAIGKAFEATPGELAEKLFAALKAGDDAGGDTRGKQSASILVVRKHGGRNLNNDRYVDIHVDDNPEPIRELRRLLDINLGLLYSEKVGPLLIASKTVEARDAAAKGAHYMPSGNSFFTVGVMDYSIDDRSAALADLRRAIKLDSAIRKQFESSADAILPGFGPIGRALRGILEDKEFLKQVLAQ